MALQVMTTGLTPSINFFSLLTVTFNVNKLTTFLMSVKMIFYNIKNLIIHRCIIHGRVLGSLAVEDRNP